MKHWGERFLVLALVGMLSACAGVQKNHIDAAAREHIDEVDTYLVVPQDEIYAEIVRSQSAAAMGGGLLFAVIDAAVDNSRIKDAESLIQPVRDQLLEFDYAQVLKREIAEQLQQIEWMDLGEPSIERSIGDGSLVQKLQGSSKSAVLVMTVDYKLTPNFDAVTTQVALLMFPNREALQSFKEKLDNNDNPVDDSDNIYRNQIIDTVSLGLTGDMEENALALSEPGSRIIQGALEESAQQIALAIFKDIQLDETSE